MTRRRAFLSLLIIAALSSPALAEYPKVGIEANINIWVTFHEQVENQLVQAGSLDEAAQEASGFNFKQGRLGFMFLSPDTQWEALIRFRLEERTDIIDFWGAFRPSVLFGAYIGQMKIPSTFEVLQRDHMIDFITRTTFGQNVGDYSLARTPYISSLMNTKSNNRDLGLSFKGAFKFEEERYIKYFLMVGNGAGAGNYIGGRESSEFFYANEFGDFLYGGRLEFCPWKPIVIGGHASFNAHDEVVLQDKQTLADVERLAWSADVQIRTPWGMKVNGFYGMGWMEDYLNSTNYQFDYEGWGVWAIQGFFEGGLEFGLRYDAFITEYMNDGVRTEQNNLTVGVNWRPVRWTRLQLNYMWKDTVNNFEDDLGDDIVFLNVQFMYKAWLLN